MELREPEFRLTHPPGRVEQRERQVVDDAVRVILLVRRDLDAHAAQRGSHIPFSTLFSNARTQTGFVRPTANARCSNAHMHDGLSCTVRVAITASHGRGRMLCVMCTRCSDSIGSREKPRIAPEAFQAQVEVRAHGAFDAHAGADVLVAVVAMVQRPAPCHGGASIDGSHRVALIMCRGQ